MKTDHNSETNAALLRSVVATIPFTESQIALIRRTYGDVAANHAATVNGVIPDVSLDPAPVNELETLFKVTRVHWHDTTHISGWHSREELEALINAPLPEMETIGWLVHTGPDFVVLAQSVGEFTAADIIKIPTSQVTDMYTLSEG